MVHGGWSGGWRIENEVEQEKVYLNVNLDEPVYYVKSDNPLYF